MDQGIADIHQAICIDFPFLMLIFFSSFFNASSASLSGSLWKQRFFDRLLDLPDPGFNVAAEMNPDHPPVARGKTFHVPQGLSSNQRPEGIGLIGNVQILALIDSDLKKHAGSGTAFMELAG